MKKFNVLIGTFALLAAFSISAAAQTNTPKVDKREKNQKQRIASGVKNGNLTGKETFKLLKQQAEIRKAERRAKSDGNVTFKERFRLHSKLNRAGRSIKNKKTN